MAFKQQLFSGTEPRALFFYMLLLIINPHTNGLGKKHNNKQMSR